MLVLSSLTYTQFIFKLGTGNHWHHFKHILKHYRFGKFLIFTVLNILETFDSSVKGHRMKRLKISWSYEVMNQSVDLLRWQSPKISRSLFFRSPHLDKTLSQIPLAAILQTVSNHFEVSRSLSSRNGAVSVVNKRQAGQPREFGSMHGNPGRYSFL